MNLPPLPKFDEWIAQAYREPHERFTKYNMEVAYQAGRKQALEEAAQVCEDYPAPLSCNRLEATLWDVATTSCADKIRELK